MRTTLTIEDDVAQQIERLQRKQNRPVKEIVNDALRRGLREMSSPGRRSARYKTAPLPLGACLVGSLDNIGELFSAIEDERFK
jgi:hypothetical protein